MLSNASRAASAACRPMSQRDFSSGVSMPLRRTKTSIDCWGQGFAETRIVSPSTTRITSAWTGPSTTVSAIAGLVSEATIKANRMWVPNLVFMKRKIFLIMICGQWE